MIEPITSTVAIARAQHVLAADYACDPRAFTEDGLTFATPAVRPGRRRFAIPARPLAIGTFGRGVVVLCNQDRQESLRALLDGAARDDIFAAGIVSRLAELAGREGQVVHGPHLTFVTGVDRLRPVAPADGFSVDLVSGDRIVSILDRAAFPHALPGVERPGRPTVAAAVARVGEQVAGVAAAGADSDDLWQIGVDVLPEAQGTGVGRAIVAALARWVLNQGRVPYYAAATGNVRSQALAISAGFRPTWTELYATNA